MEWNWIFAILIGLYFIYKLIGSAPNKTAHKIGQAINVKPNFIHDMIAKMGVERGQLFINTINSNDSINDGVYTFFIYQLLLNDHPQNVKWWQDKLYEFNYSADLDLAKVETAFMFLREMDVDVGKANVFLTSYRKNFVKTAY